MYTVCKTNKMQLPFESKSIRIFFTLGQMPKHIPCFSFVIANPIRALFDTYLFKSDEIEDQT